MQELLRHPVSGGTSSQSALDDSVFNFYMFFYDGFTPRWIVYFRRLFTNHFGELYRFPGFLVAAV